MDRLGGYFEPSGGQWIPTSLFVGILLLVAALERLQHSLRRTESALWWASNGRDVVNLFAFAVLSFGIRLLGFFGPMVFLLSGATVVLLTAAQGLGGEGKSASWIAVALICLLGLPLLAWPMPTVFAARWSLEHFVP
jgi:hypothetical protein